MSALPAWALATILALFGLSLFTQSGGSGTYLSTYTAYAEAAPAAAVIAPPTNATAVATIAPAAAAPAAPSPRHEPQELSILRTPSIDVATIRRVLVAYDSPAVDEAETIYRLGQQYGIDPAICLAFFVMESSAGTQGIARTTHSLGNIRATRGYEDYKGYRKYATWRDGIEDWYQLIARLYVRDWQLTTVEAIVPVYAPAEDSNDPEQYIRTVRELVTTWRAGK